jgi:hypothetical protein
MSGTIPLLPLYDFMTWTEKTFYLYLLGIFPTGREKKFPSKEISYKDPVSSTLTFRPLVQDRNEGDKLQAATHSTRKIALATTATLVTVIQTMTNH